MTRTLISDKAFEAQATDARRTMADEFRAQDEVDRLGRIAYFKGRLAQEQSNHFFAVYTSQLDVCNERIARYRKIIKTLEGE